MPDKPPLLEQISGYRWRVPENAAPGMRVPGEIFATPEMIPRIIQDKTPEQVANVATLPGIIRASLAMPDIHWGYGFPIGGVAAFDLDEGVISPGGVGYDINCGVCLVRSNLSAGELRGRMKKLIDSLFEAIPCGVGSEGKIKLSNQDFNKILAEGAKWVVEQGFAQTEDLTTMEETGAMTGGNPDLVSAKARQRAQNQLGTLGSGNHFIEVQEVVEIYDEPAAAALGLFKNQAVVMIHSGSRGLGHQICDESLGVMQTAIRRYGLELPDRQLACAPFTSPEGQEYFQAMKCAANFAWGNRLAMVGLARKAFQETLKMTASQLGMKLIYDVCHNIAKIEEFNIEGKVKKLCVHRKGATRALGPGDARIPENYRQVGQPVLIPGDMGRASFVLTGCADSAALTFNSTCHGAGRLMSRNAAIKKAQNTNIYKRLEDAGIIVRAKGKLTLLEEIPEAYKDVQEVVEAVQGAGISKRVAKLKPTGTVKG